MAEVSLITDSMRRDVGKLLFTQTVEIEKGMIVRFAEAIQSNNPLWQDENFAQATRYGTIIAPPSFIFVVNYFGRPRLQASFPELIPFEVPGKSVLDSSLEAEIYEPIRPGDVLATTISLGDVREVTWSSDRRLLVTFAINSWNQKGRHVAKVLRTFVCL